MDVGIVISSGRGFGWWLGWAGVVVVELGVFIVGIVADDGVDGILGGGELVFAEDEGDVSEVWVVEGGFKPETVGW